MEKKKKDSVPVETKKKNGSNRQSITKGTKAVRLHREKLYAIVQVELNSGVSYDAITRKYGISSSTIANIATGRIYINKEEVEALKRNEIKDLHVLGSLSRAFQSNILGKALLCEDGKEAVKIVPAIAAVAIQDRAFQQRRILEGSGSSSDPTNITEEISGATDEVIVRRIVERIRETREIILRR